MSDPFPIDGSRDALWTATAVEAPGTTRLGASARCDAAIVGAGFTGLNAALRLAEKGASVCVLEAKHLGFGSSGRSGGQINLGLNAGPKALIERFGARQGERLLHRLAQVPNDVFALIRRHRRSRPHARCLPAGRLRRPHRPARGASSPTWPTCAGTTIGAAGSP